MNLAFRGSKDSRRILEQHRELTEEEKNFLMTRDEGAIRVEEPFIPWIFPYQASLDSRLVFLVTSRIHCAVLDKDARKKIRVYAYRPVHFGKITVCRLKMAAAMKKEQRGAEISRSSKENLIDATRQVWWSRNSTFSVSLYIIFILENPRHLSKYQGCWRSSVSSVYFLKGRKTRLEGRRKRKSGKRELEDCSYVLYTWHFINCCVAQGFRLWLEK